MIVSTEDVVAANDSRTALFDFTSKSDLTVTNLRVNDQSWWGANTARITSYNVCYTKLLRGYTGWIDSLPGGYKVWREELQGIITGGMLTCIREDGSRMTLMPGSELFGLREDLSAFSLGDEHFLTPGTDITMLAPHLSVEETALHFLIV